MSSAVQGQKPLSLILDEIEMMARLALPPTGIADYVKWSPDQVCNICKIDVPALVKALRRSREQVQLLACHNPSDHSRFVIASCEREVVAILNQGRSQ